LRWVRLAIGLAALGYGASGIHALLFLRPIAPRHWAELPTALVCASAFFLARSGRPLLASYLTVGAAWAELTSSIAISVGAFPTTVPIYVALVLTTGLLLGPWASLVCGVATLVGAPAAAYLSGQLGFGLERFDGSTQHAFVVFAAVVVVTMFLVRGSLLVYADVLTKARTSEQRYADLFQNAPDGLLALDAAGRIEDVNWAAAAMLGRAPEQLPGERFASLVEPENDVDFEGWLHPAEGAVQASAIAVQPKANAERWLEVKRPDVVQQGRSGLQVVLRDVSERRRADDERGRLQEQLWHAQKLEAVGQLAGGIAHDFNNLLTVVGGTASLLEEHGDLVVADLARDLLLVRDQGVTLTRQLLTFSRRESSHLEVVDLGTAVGSARRLLRRLLGERHELVVENCSDACAVVDRGQVEQVLFNLVANAGEALTSPGKVAVRVLVMSRDQARHAGSPLSGDQVVLEVQDTGVGMTDAIQQRLFEPFFTTKERGRGTGLGLATVHGIVSSWGGAIVVDSQVGEGSRFRVFVLRSTDTPSETSSSRLKAARAPWAARILVVEDEPFVRSVCARILRSAGHKVALAEGGSKALELFARETFDLVLTDVMMPGMSGTELAEQLHAKKSDVPVLFMSGYLDQGMAEDGKVPKERLLRKPFTGEELTACVRKLLDPRKRRPPSAPML
jgi:PAS domain S-box-containing protein